MLKCNVIRIDHEEGNFLFHTPQLPLVGDYICFGTSYFEPTFVVKHIQWVVEDKYDGKVTAINILVAEVL